MEESERRRERLSAMRALATAGPEASGEAGPGPVGLFNPLLEEAPGRGDPVPAPRFDFYTDPMAAFSGNKARFPRPGASYQVQGGYRPDQPPGPYRVPPWGPRDAAGPLPLHQGAPPEAGRGFPRAPGWIPRGGRTGSSYPSPRHQGSRPVFGPVAGGAYDYGRWRGPSFRGPSHNAGSGSHGSSGSGRSQGRWSGGNRSPVVVGRGRGFASGGYLLDDSYGPENFYHRSMLEDPWQHMEPVLWKGLDAPTNDSGASGSWLPNSIGAKKQRVSEPVLKPSPGQSLAEYLAASFKEVADDESSQ